MVPAWHSPMTKVYNRKYLPSEANMATARKISLSVILALASIPAWGQAGKNASPNNPQVFDKTGVAAVGTDAVPQAVNPSTYLIGPEDILKIEVYREDQLSRLVNVRPDGKITLLLIGDVQAEGLTPERLTAQVKEAYSQTLINPEVTISVMAVNSKSFTITGKVNRPGRMPLVTPMKILRCARPSSAAFRTSPTLKKITIRARHAERLYFNYNDYVEEQEGNALDQNVWLQNGDTIYVK